MTPHSRTGAVLSAVDQIPVEYFSMYGGGWIDEISTALLDAVFSIRARYRAADPSRGVSGRVRTFRDVEAGARDNLVVLSSLGSVRIGEIIGFGTTGGRPKSEAVIAASDRFIAAGIIHARDFLEADAHEMKRTYTSVRGLGWVTFEYFTMLLGVPGVKADTMITRFVNNALIAANIEPVGSHSAREIVVDTFDKSGRNGSLSAFENALWRFQSDS
ncbi:hypothetical protein [Brevibacterium casei]|uniref:hypothetical protein n=1 Tax=Brevibacterium casei TaxID=33889 RepID=UPI001140AF08|nr:hypothetical protein [Brevibacterium casei]